MDNTKRGWLIAGAAAALVLVPAGVSLAVTNTADGGVPRDAYRIQAPINNPAGNGPNTAAGRAGGQYGGQNGAGNGIQDRTRDQDRDQVRDPSYCGDDGPIGQGPPQDRTNGPGMMGGRGPGRG